MFGWHVRHRADGSVGFDDGVNEVSGTWRADRRPAGPGVLVHVMVNDVAATLAAAVALGGRVVEPMTGDGNERYAQVVDPAGNVVGVFQQ